MFLTGNRDTLTSTVASLDIQIADTIDPAFQKPLILQRERLEMQIESISPMIEMLEGYREKLKIKN